MVVSDDFRSTVIQKFPGEAFPQAPPSPPEHCELYAHRKLCAVYTATLCMLPHSSISASAPVRTVGLRVSRGYPIAVLLYDKYKCAMHSLIMKLEYLQQVSKHNVPLPSQSQGDAHVVRIHCIIIAL